MLIQNAEIDGRVSDVAIANGIVVAIGSNLASTPDGIVIDAAGTALLPGLNDHHLHLASLAASLQSLECGPPSVTTEDDLARRLGVAATSEKGWLRGTGYHESVAGAIDRHWLDRHIATRPVRIQHRSGRLWILNSRALAEIGEGTDTPLESVDGTATGRLYNGDDWLRERLGGSLPSLKPASQLLASFGVTGITDATPDNDTARQAAFAAASSAGDILQDVLMMGNASLDRAATVGAVARGPRKIYLREADLPDFDGLVGEIATAHRAGRTVAFHCVTLSELMLALAALHEAGALHGDRIEHAGIAPPEAIAMAASLPLTVVTQPNFIAERGDAYLSDVDAKDVPWLYRLKAWQDAGISLAAGTDAPFGHPDPWAAMAAAVTRRTASGKVIGAGEALSPEAALALFLIPLGEPGGAPRRVTEGAIADLCLLDRPWQDARRDLAAVRVRMTIKDGRVVWTRAG